MECDKKCYWNYNGTCAYEDEEKYEEGQPEENKECPNQLREDFEQHFHETHRKIIGLQSKRTCAELEEIEEFILNQREGAKDGFQK
jgi:ferritin-like metal-binding protein YciE